MGLCGSNNAFEHQQVSGNSPVSPDIRASITHIESGERILSQDDYGQYIQFLRERGTVTTVESKHANTFSSSQKTEEKKHVFDIKMRPDYADVIHTINITVQWNELTDESEKILGSTNWLKYYYN